MKAIPFFTDDITLNVHSATNKSHLGLSTIKDFIDEFGPMIRVFELENGELHVEEVSSNAFMTGVEV